MELSAISNFALKGDRACTVNASNIGVGIQLFYATTNCLWILIYCFYRKWICEVSSSGPWEDHRESFLNITLQMLNPHGH